MLKAVSAALLSVVALASAGHAAAQVVSPPPGSFVIQGNVRVTQSSPLTCDTKLGIVMNPGGLTGYVVAAHFGVGSVGCIQLTPRNLPWTVNYVGPGAIELVNVAVNTPAGYCDNGQINVIWNNAAPGSGTLTSASPFPGTIPPFVSYPIATCEVLGAFIVISGGPVTVL